MWIHGPNLSGLVSLFSWRRKPWSKFLKKWAKMWGTLQTRPQLNHKQEWQHRLEATWRYQPRHQPQKKAEGKYFDVALMSFSLFLTPTLFARRRQKMRSTPVVGGGLFGEGGREKEAESGDSGANIGGGMAPTKRLSKNSLLSSFQSSGHAAEIIVDGEVYKIRVNDETLRNLRSGYSGEMLDSRGISVGGGLRIEQDESPIVSRLQGYVRNIGPLGMISEAEEADDKASELSSTDGKNPQPKEGPSP